MSKFGEQKILEQIRPLGLSNQKAKHLAGCREFWSNSTTTKSRQRSPNWKHFRALGHKTASVVMSQAFGVPAFPVDTHIHRLAQRWGLSNGKSVVQTERDLKQCFPKESWNKRHLQIIFYGREFCTARGCDGTKCDLCRELYPKRKKPVEWKKP